MKNDAKIPKGLCTAVFNTPTKRLALMSAVTLSLAVPALADYVPGCVGSGNCDYDFSVDMGASHCSDGAEIYCPSAYSTKHLDTCDGETTVETYCS